MYTELVVIGILIAVLVYECTHLSPGGLVTPVYLAICLTSPFRILYTAIIVAVAFGVIKLIGRFWILYGKRLFAITVAITFLLDLLLGATGIFPLGIRAIGYIVPALLVRDIDRQGIVKTAVPMCIASALCALVMLWMGVL